MKSESSKKKKPNKRVLTAAGIAAACLVALGGLLLFPVLRGSKTSHSKIDPETAKTQDALYATYGKSPSCKSCHEEAHALWQDSHHAQAERPIDRFLDAPAFQSHFKIRHGSQVSFANTNKKGQFQIITEGPARKPQTFHPERVLAVDPLRQMLVPFGNGRYQATELAYDPHHPDWFNVYGEEDRRAGEWGHWTGRGMTWNVMCAACHNTRVSKNYIPRIDGYETRVAEMGVGCEACHGPMQDHNQWQAQHPNQQGDPTIKKLSREEMFDVCASCHSRRSELTGDFHPRQKFFDHYSISIPDDSDLFYPDGQIRDEDFEVTAFLGSRMHTSNVRCIDCHDPHGGKVRLAGNNLCMVCHAAPAPPAPKIDPATHSHHKPGTRGDLCTDCHMPQTVYMQRHARHDHGFTIPDPLLTRQFGIPNACNRCHSERDTAWAEKYVQEWYGDRMNRPYRQRTEVIAAARLPSGKPDGLLGLMKTETNAFWRAVSANLLRRWASEPKVTPVLLQAASDAHPLVRAMSIRALESLGPGNLEVANTLRRALADPLRLVRIDAAWALRSTVATNSTAGQDLASYLRHTADQPSGAMQQAVFHLDRGQVDSALDQLRRALTWDTNSAPIYHAYAVALSMAEKPTEALTALETACRLAPGEPEFRFKLALALNELGRLSEATSALEYAVQLDPEYPQAWYNLGLAYNAQNRTRPALDALARAESVDLRSSQIPYARATILAREGRVPEATAALNEALKRNPQDQQAADLLDLLLRP